MASLSAVCDVRALACQKGKKAGRPDVWIFFFFFFLHDVFSFNWGRLKQI